MNTLERAQQYVKEIRWAQWRNQFRAVVGMDLRRNLLSKRGIPIYFLAFAPVGIILLHAIFDRHEVNTDLDGDTKVLAGIVQLYYLRLGIFFGSLGIFTWLFRGEVVQKSLHYYFLAPIRRELLVVSKFTAGLIASVLIFGSGVLASFLLMYAHFGEPGWQFIESATGLKHLTAYLLITVLACVGFGSLFLALSLFFKNPAIPGAIVLIWETFSGFLPSFLQKLSITFYLKNLAPVEVVTEGILALFTVAADPVSPWLAVPGILLISVVVLVVACFRIHELEISYSTE